MHNLQRTKLHDLTFTGLGPSDLASQVYMINCFTTTTSFICYCRSGLATYKKRCGPAAKINKLKIFLKIEKSKVVYSWHSLIQTLNRNQNLFKYANVRGIGQCFLLPLRWLHIDCKSFAGFICCSRQKNLK